MERLDEITGLKNRASGCFAEATAWGVRPWQLFEATSKIMRQRLERYRDDRHFDGAQAVLDQVELIRTAAIDLADDKHHWMTLGMIADCEECGIAHAPARLLQAALILSFHDDPREALLSLSDAFASMVDDEMEDVTWRNTVRAVAVARAEGLTEALAAALETHVKRRRAAARREHSRSKKSATKKAARRAA